MAIFNPYTIHHLQFSGIEKASLPAGNHYLLIWSGQVPLGHFWLEADKGPVLLANYKEELEAIVRPALEERDQAARAAGRDGQGSAGFGLQAASDKPDEQEGQGIGESGGNA